LAGISLAMSWWMMGKNGGQFFSSIGTPAETENKENSNKSHYYKQIS
jgi:hypothetical protein